MKFVGQIFEVTTQLPTKTFTDADKDLLRTRFIEDYESEFGSGTAWTEAEILLVNSRVKAVGRTEAQEAQELLIGAEDASSSTREGVDPATGERGRIDVHRGFSAIGKADGPCLLEEPDTTVYVPRGATVSLIDGGHFAVRLDAQ